MCVLANWLYLEVLLVAAWVAAAPACVAELATCASVYVSSIMKLNSVLFIYSHVLL